MNIHGMVQFSAANNLFDDLVSDLSRAYMTIINVFFDSGIGNVGSPYFFVISVHYGSAFVILVDN